MPQHVETDRNAFRFRKTKGEEMKSNQRFTATCTNWIPLIVAVVLLVVFNASLAIASSGTLEVTSDTTLTEDHYGNIFIVGDNITLDCANHTVSGPGVAGIYGGIEVYFGTGVTVKRCKVTGFPDVNGIYAVGTSDSRYENNTIIGNGANGMHLDGGFGNQVTGNTVRSNGGNGIAITTSTQTLIEQNTVQDHKTSEAGIAVISSDHNMVVANISSRNANGFVVDGGVSNDLVNNTANANPGTGFLFIRSANSNSAWLNVSNGNQFGFIVTESSNQNLLGSNTANQNQLEGFNIFSSNNNSLTGNIADGNGTYGFLVFGGSSYTVVNQNTGHKNSQFDAYQEGTGTGNMWRDNRFGTTLGL
jgi:parallel beta-helix repeat protein